MNQRSDKTKLQNRLINRENRLVVAIGKGGERMGEVGEGEK